MRFSEIIAEGRKKKSHLVKHKSQKRDIEIDDLDVVEPEASNEESIVMQLRSAQDFDGDQEIKFADGSKHLLSIDDINKFLNKYETLKPLEKEKMQQIASQSKHGFEHALKMKWAVASLPKIKGSRYMSNFAGDFDDK